MMKNTEDNVWHILKNNGEELPIFFKKIATKTIVDTDNTYVKSITVDKYGTTRVAVGSFYKLPTRIL